MDSLYRAALVPLSDEFQQLEAFWRQRDRTERNRLNRSEALLTLSSFPDKLSFLENSLARANADVATALRTSSSTLSQLRSELDALSELCGSYKAAKTLDERLAIMPRDTKEYCQACEIKQRLDNLETEKRSTYSPPISDEQRERLAKLSSSINRLRGKLGTLVGTPYAAAKNRMSSLDSAIRRLGRSPEQIRGQVSSIENEIKWLNARKTSSEHELAKIAKIDFNSEDRITTEQYDILRKRGYGDNVLRTDHPSAIDVVKALVLHRRIGITVSQTIGSSGRLKILFLAANPRESSQLDLEEELRAIENEIRGTLHRDKIGLIARHAVRADDLVRYLRADSPDVVHFSGHGTSEGIVLRDEATGYRIVRGEALARLLKNRGVKLIVMNACFSNEQAGSLSDVVETIIGTTTEVGDEAARRFSVAFYRTLCDGHTVHDAFRDGGDSIALHNLEDVYQLIGKTDERFVGA